MKKYGAVLFLMLMVVSLVLAPTAEALDPPTTDQVIFSEILPSTSQSSSQEFIEIYNNTVGDIDLAGWHIQYTSATKTDWSSPSRNIALSGTILAGEYYLLATAGYLSDKSNLVFSSTLSQSGGHLRILDAANTLQDQIGWGSALMPLGVAAISPAAGNSIARLANTDGFNLSHDNSTDYAETLTPTPLLVNSISAPALSDDTESTDATDTPSTPPVKVEYALVQISEVLPNPAAPQTDARDEFVELYNPNLEDVDLSGYIIAAGLNSTYKYVIKDLVISSGGYQVFYSGSTNLSLSNSVGKVQLLAPDGSLVDETSDYQDAPIGQAWIFNNGAWVWTASPTPGEDNVLTAAVVKAASAKKTSPKTAKSKSSTRKSAKTASKKKAAKPTVPLSTLSTAPKTTKVHPAILASVGSGALIYALYEYKNDVANGLYRFNRYRAAGRDFWPAYSRLTSSRIARGFGRRQNNLRTWFGARLRK